MYSVYDCGRPAKYPETNVHPSWSNNEFNTFKEAEEYANLWISGGKSREGVAFKVNEPYDYSGYADCVVIKEPVKKV